MEENNFLRAYKEYLELYLRYLDRNPRIDEIYISDGRRLKVEDSDTGIYQFGISESEFLRLDKMMSGELKVLINEQEYENEILSFDKESTVIRLKGIREGRIEKVCLAGDAEFLKRITEKQKGILESPHENQRNLNILFGNFEGAERVSCSFENNRVEQEQRQKDAVEFSVGVKDLFLIWGPPGTGKSTIVPEIIRNYLARNSDAKILVCSYANGAVDRIVEIICEDTNLRQKIVRVGPCQIKEEYSGIKLVEIINNVFKGVINRIKSHKERLTELDKEEREHIDDARERIRRGISALENEIGALKGEEKSLRNHKWLIENEISESEDAIIRLRDKEMILDGKIASLEEEREKIKHLSKIVEIYLSFAERMVPWLRRRNFRRDPRYISHRSMIDRFNLENLTRDELRSLERSNQKRMEEIKRPLSELQSSLEGVSEERIGRENEIGDSRRKLRAVEEEIKAKQRKESDLEDEKAKLEDSLNAKANEMLPLIRRLNIIAKERFNRLERIINGIAAERGVISREIKSLKERISSSRSNQEKEILNRKQIIATTNLKLLTSLFDDLHFDLAIMDEAGFTDLPAALGPFVKADKLILIGDHKQLQPIIQEKDHFERHVQQYPFIKKSIFELFWEKRQSENKGIMLNKQYRMKEEIASFISEEFYDGLLETGLIEERSNLNDAEDSVISFRCPLVFININAWEKREWKSWFCAGEIELVKRVLKKFAEEHEGERIYDKIGVITPFRPQSNRMKDKIPKEVACGTVHVFQGHEKPIVICSTVRQTERGRRSLPLLDERLLNVAVSRAMHKFILLGNKNVLYQIPHYRALIDHAEQYGEVYEEIPEGYDYTNRCEYCGRPIEKRYEFCAACRNAVEHERDRGGLTQFIDGIIVRSQGKFPTVAGIGCGQKGSKRLITGFRSTV
ncbi:MAG: AAA domain-containing protein [Halobacteriota archaeon]